jgi:hypothetical protein
MMPVLLILVSVVVGLLNSKCSQQNRANKNKHGAHSQGIQSQGKVHFVPPLLMGPKLSTKPQPAVASQCVAALNFLRAVMRGLHDVGKRLFARSKRAKCGKNLHCGMTGRAAIEGSFDESKANFAIVAACRTAICANLHARGNADKLTVVKNGRRWSKK